MTDAFLAYLTKAEADFRAALDNLRRARKVYDSFLAQREQALQGRADTPSEPSPPAEQSVNASLLPGLRAGYGTGEGGHVGTNATDPLRQEESRCSAPAEPAEIDLTIPEFLIRERARA